MTPGTVIAGRYRLLRPIGAGGMGTVWAARHEVLGREFAVKVALTPRRASDSARARFLQEAQIVGRLRHPNVVDVADAGELEAGAGLYLVMELLTGDSLAERLKAAGPMPLKDALGLAIEVCRGLAAAHAAGVVHRDIKPENIYLARGAEGGVVPKLLDFGISKLDGATTQLATLQGQLYGTPAYMSPEQALGEATIDVRTDVWALGVVLYEMLSGKLPFEADSYPALLPKIAEQAHPPLDAPEPVRAIVDRCLQKARGDRFASAEELRAALEDAARELGVARDAFVERRTSLPSMPPLSPRVELHEGHRTASHVSVLETRPPPRAPRWRAPVAIGVVAAAAVAVFALRTSPDAPTRAASASDAATAAPASASPAATAAASSGETATAPSASASAAATVEAAPSATAAPAAKKAAGQGRATGAQRPAPSPGKKGPVTKVDSAGF